MFNNGDEVLYTTKFGRGKVVNAIIIDTGMKNGQLVYDVELEDGTIKWGYVDQISRP